MMSSQKAVLYNKPMPRQEWVDGKFVKNVEENEEPWVELFLDLMFVVLLSVLGAIHEHCHQTPSLIARTFVYFVSVCLTRQALDEYSNRFYCHDLVQKILYLIYTFGVLFQVFALNFGHDNHDDSCSYISEQTIGISTGIVVTRISLIAIYLFVIYHHNLAWAQFRYDLFRWTLTSFLMLLTVILHKNDIRNEKIDTFLLGVAAGLELILWIGSRVLFRVHFHFPVNLEMLQSRWGVWVMIVIGESVIQMLHRSVSKYRAMDTLLYIVIAVALLFSLSMQYYDACHVEWFNHALTKSAVAGVSWIWLHVPLTYCIFRIGIYFNFELEYVNHHGEVSALSRSKFSLSMTIISVILTLLRVTHTSMNSSLPKAVKYSYFLRIVLSALQLGVVPFVFTTSHGLLAAQFAICVFFNLVDIFGEILREKEDLESPNSSGHIKPQEWSKLQIYVTDQHTILALGNESVDSNEDPYKMLAQSIKIANKENFPAEESVTAPTNTVRNKVSVNLRDLFDSSLFDSMDHKPKPIFFGDKHHHHSLHNNSNSRIQRKPSKSRIIPSEQIQELCSRQSSIGAYSIQSSNCESNESSFRPFVFVHRHARNISGEVDVCDNGVEMLSSHDLGEQSSNASSGRSYRSGRSSQSGSGRARNGISALLPFIEHLVPPQHLPSQREPFTMIDAESNVLEDANANASIKDLKSGNLLVIENLPVLSPKKTQQISRTHSHVEDTSGALNV